MNIEDERAITAVLLRYAQGIDCRDWQLFATCFTEDFEADYGDLGCWRGRASFVDRMEKGHVNYGPTLHRLTNLVVVGNGEEATAKSYVDAVLMPAESGGTMRRAEGWYEDKLVREAAGWKIRQRRFVSVVMSDTVTPSR